MKSYYKIETDKEDLFAEISKEDKGHIETIKKYFNNYNITSITKIDKFEVYGNDTVPIRPTYELSRFK